MGLKDIFTTQKPIETEQQDNSNDSIATISGAS